MNASTFNKTFCIITVLISLHAQARPQAVTFSDTCEAGEKIIIGAVGDFLMHDPLQKKASRQGTFMKQWQQVQPYLHGVDIMYGNLETPAARGLGQDLVQRADPGLVYDRVVHTSYPLFNVHPTLVDDIKRSGFDIVSTANNHALDRSSKGVNKTIDELERAGLAFVGSRRQDEQRNWYNIVEAKGFKTAWISCTFLLGNADRYNQILKCDKDNQDILGMIRDLRSKVDAVIVVPHWGDEFQNTQSSTQTQYGKSWLDAGAALVLGSHPHVLQPMQMHLTPDGRETFIIYSLANFISFQPSTERKSTVILFVGLTKNSKGQTFINGVRYLPAFMQNRTGDLMDVELLPIKKDQAYGQEGLRHIFNILPQENSLAYGEKVITNPECRLK